MRNLPCLRYKVTEVRLFREGSFAAGREWSHRWVSNKLVNIKAWASPEVKELRITQDYGPSAITLRVREFVPIKGDMLHRQWADGAVTKSVTIPNFAILDMAAALQTYKEFIVSEGPHFFKSAVDYNDRLLWSTYSAAIKYSNTSNVSNIVHFSSWQQTTGGDATPGTRRERLTSNGPATVGSYTSDN